MHTLIGFISIQGILLGLVLCIFGIIGLIRGLHREFRSFIAVFIALAVSVYPKVHHTAAASLSNITAQASYLAYILVSLLLLVILLFVFRLIPNLGSIRFVNWLNQVLGLVAGLFKGFFVCTLLLLVIYGWELPFRELYVRSEIGLIIAKIWHQFGLLPELFSFI